MAENKTKKRKSVTRKNKLNLSLAEILMHFCIFILIVCFMFLFSSLSGDLQDLYPHVNKVQNFIQNTTNPDPGNVSSDMNQGISIMKGFFVKLTLGLILLGALAITFSTAIRGFVYSVYSEYSFKSFIKYFAKYNILWQVFWIILFILSMNLFKDILVPIVLLLEILLYIILTPIFRSILTKEKALKIVLKKSYRLIFPIGAVFIALIVNILILAAIAQQPSILFLLFNYIFTLAIIIVGRGYTLKVISDMK
ncbi:MAG: hypothetical protein ACQESF_05805 [Nanobdellota archaeon]